VSVATTVVREFNPDDMSWDEFAACFGHPEPDIWHADGTSNKPWDVEARTEAKLICVDMCKARGECLAYALRTNQPTGIWGGLSPRDRTLLRNRLARRA
jgi:WhiB family redox-sensing transcriptional regulator